MTFDRLKFSIERNPAYDVLRLYIFANEHFNNEPGISSATPIEFKKLPELPAAAYLPPALELRFEDAQALMDELWNAGLRPTEGTGSAGALAAVQNHLNDLRKITAHALKMNAPLIERKERDERSRI